MIVSNLIISTKDPRYGKIGHLWRRYNWYNLFKGEGRNRVYYIPQELVLYDKITHRGTEILKKSNQTSNWINNNSFNNILWQTCNITVQDYCDLLVYHINNRQNRPRCRYCNSYLDFHKQMNQMYGTFCSESCSVSYWHIHSEALRLHDIENISSLKSRVKSERNSLYSRGQLEEIVRFYVSLTLNGFYKFGVTRNIDDRISFSRLDGSYYQDIVYNIELTRKDAGNLEAILKLQNNGSEWISPDEIQNYLDKIETIKGNIFDPFI